MFKPIRTIVETIVKLATFCIPTCYCKFTLFSFADEFGIKEPFPENIYPIKGTETKVTCVAFDSLGVKTPERIQFVRRDQYARYTNITASENVIFTERIEFAVPPASELFLFGHS